MKIQIKDLIGKSEGNLIILEKLPSRNGRTMVRCACKICGRSDYIAILGNVREKEYKSCGCLQYQNRENNPKWQGVGEMSKSFFLKIQISAKQRDIPFSVKMNDLWNLFLEQERKCAFSKLELTFPKHLRDYSQTASLDRIDSSKPYETGNVQWIHKDINYMKMDLSQKEFLNYCKIITQNNQ